ncbi:MAG: DUF934 domain-containing protein [Bauldia sp.]
MPLWKDGRFLADDWPIVEDDALLPEGKCLVGVERWRRDRVTLADRNVALGLLIAPGTAWNEVVGDLARFPVVAVSFPKYGDGRAFSIARLLRERDGYAGEIRAVGAYIIDQVPLMMRVGFDAFLTDNPILIRAFEMGEWPEVPHYLQPALDRDAEVPAGSRPWLRVRRRRD